jgi:hypothetical protein
MSMFQSPVYKNTKPGGSGRIRRKKIKTPSACVRACVARRIGGHDTTTVFSFLFSYYYAPRQVVRVTFLWNKLRTRVHVAVLASHGMMDPVCSETARPYIRPSPMRMARHTVREMPTSSPRSACKPARSGHLLLSSASP